LLVVTRNTEDQPIAHNELTVVPRPNLIEMALTLGTIEGFLRQHAKEKYRWGEGENFYFPAELGEANIRKRIQLIIDEVLSNSPNDASVSIASGGGESMEVRIIVIEKNRAKMRIS